MQGTKEPKLGHFPSFFLLLLMNERHFYRGFFFFLDTNIHRLHCSADSSQRGTNFSHIGRKQSKISGRCLSSEYTFIFWFSVVFVISQATATKAEFSNTSIRLYNQ